MNKQRLNAISYAYAEKRKGVEQKELKRRGLDFFAKYSSFKTARGLLNATPQKLGKDARQALPKITERMYELAASRCTSDIAKEAQQAYKQAMIVATI